MGVAQEVGRKSDDTTHYSEQIATTRYHWLDKERVLMPVQPLNDFVFVELIEEEGSASGLIMIDSSSTSCKRARVVSLSSGTAAPISVGCVVFLPRAVHTQSITHKGVQLFCVRWQEIGGVEFAS